MSELHTLARPYARAAYYFAKDDDSHNNNHNNNITQWSKALAVLSELVSNEKLVNHLKRTDIDNKTKIDLLLNLLDTAPKKIGNFLELLAVNKRLLLLSSIYKVFVRYQQLSEQELDVEITSAQALTDEQLKDLEQQVSRRIHKKVNLSSAVDSSLIAGCILRFDDTVVDNSVKGKLVKMQAII